MQIMVGGFRDLATLKVSLDAKHAGISARLKELAHKDDAESNRERTRLLAQADLIIDIVSQIR
ncbi:hypothetical protein HGI30_16665 [Paenibacillus albicereus]|uniref:Uncharacterized protein n=1 Tax=Paenibacillus albicereus TaxID=2726185 RepID=A0A6H2H029_9BACL|nr:hypothetical protein [Paenibacillus albicereus]QJC53044.1 hypothetical protein HGI30_16665 [Paenibacillus albicereus]